MKQDISNEIEKIISYCKSKECDECKYRANDDLCNLHNPTAWNVNQMNEMEAIRELKSLSPSESSIETVLNLIEKQDKIIDYMAEEIASYNHYEALGKLEDKDCVKQYFNQKIEKGE